MRAVLCAIIRLHTYFDIGINYSFEEWTFRHFIQWPARRCCITKMLYAKDMRPKTSALVSHQKRFLILLTYVQLGNHTRKHRVNPIREKFCIHKPQKQKQHPCGHLNAPKVFRRLLQVNVAVLNLHCQSTNQNAFACEVSFLFGLCGCAFFRHTFELTGS